MRKTSRPFSHYQIALVLLAVLPLIAVFGVMTWWQTEALRDSIRRGMLSTADALSLAIDREIGTIRASLETLAASDAIDRRDIPAMHLEAGRVAERRPGSWIVIAEVSGQYLINTSLPLGTRLPNRFREDMAPPRVDELPHGVTSALKQVIETGRANNSDLFISIVHKQPVLAVNVPVVRDGVLKYVVSMTFPPQGLTDLLSAGIYDRDGGGAIMDSRGFIITRSQEPEKFIGRRAAPMLFPPADAPARGLGVGTTVTGEEIHRAYVRSPVTGWIVSTGVTAAALERQIAVSLVHTALIGVGALLVSVVLALWFAARLRAPITALASKATGHAAGAASHFMPTELLELERAIDAGERARAAEAAERELRVAAEARKEESEGANRAKDRFLAMLGHELRNPLAAIANAVAVMEKAPQTSVSMTPIVRRQSEHLRKLVDDLLDVARVTSGKIRLMPEHVDLYELASGCIETFVRTGRSAHHRLSIKGDSVIVYVDRHRMTQVLTNLLDNALKFTPAGGCIDVTVRDEGAEGVLRVEDNGSGIPPESIASIFDVFAQADQPPGHGQSGLGLGLALAKSLVEMQHGSITAESGGSASGAAFTIRFPRATKSHEENAAALEPSATVAVQKRRVLVVEDQPDTRRALRALLELEGHDVTEAVDGRSAIETAQSSRPDIAIVDIGLPDVSGLEVARTMRSHAMLREIRLVALTGFGAPEDRDKALQAGFDLFVTKPIEAPLLREALKSRDC
ncbi:MAG TPA: ATP-binding protein [Burkholderiales bacterium]|nr:ATP-binding protein [Burkholderiales bacterium]